MSKDMSNLGEGGEFMKGKKKKYVKRYRKLNGGKKLRERFE